MSVSLCVCLYMDSVCVFACVRVRTPQAHKKSRHEDMSTIVNIDFH